MPAKGISQNAQRSLCWVENILLHANSANVYECVSFSWLFIKQILIQNFFINYTIWLPVIPEVTLGGHSSGSLTVPRCKIGTGLGLEIQSWLWGGSLRARESRVQAMMDPPWLWNPWVKSTKSKTESTSGSTKWWHVTAKFKKKRLPVLSFNTNDFTLCACVHACDCVCICAPANLIFCLWNGIGWMV